MKKEGFQKGIDMLETYDPQFLRGLYEALEAFYETNDDKAEPPHKMDMEYLKSLKEVKFMNINNTVLQKVNS